MDDKLGMREQCKDLRLIGTGVAFNRHNGFAAACTQGVQFLFYGIGSPCSMVGGTLFGLCYLLIPSLADLLDRNFSGPAIPCAVLTSVICVVVTLCTKRSGKSEQEILDTVLAGRPALASK